jgi:futalosine hydrolase
MKIGIAAATLFEIQPAIDFLLRLDNLPLQHDFEILITGIGSLASVYQLTSFINKESPGYMIQAGIGGSFNEELPPGVTVLIGEEIMGDVGAEENGLFKDLFDLGLMKPSSPPYNGRSLSNPGSTSWKQFGLPIVNGLTVNEITTRQQRINQLKDKYHCDIESMEGAAFHYVCLQEDIPFLQMRSVSNYVGERDKTKWKLKDSIENLNTQLIKMIQQIP